MCFRLTSFSKLYQPQFSVRLLILNHIHQNQKLLLFIKQFFACLYPIEPKPRIPTASIFLYFSLKIYLLNFFRCLRFFHTLKKQLVIKFNSFLFKLNKHISKDIKLLSCKSSAIGHIPFL